MSGQEVAQTMSGPGNMEKTRFLLGRDLAMMSAASRYNLDKEDERFASNEALVKLFASLCKGVKPDLFIEAGAWDASASRRAKADLPDARVVAFEANPYLYGSYKKRNVEAGVEYLHQAVTDRSGTVTFNVLRDEAGDVIVNGRSSLLRRTKKGDDARGFEEREVEGVALDTFLGGYAYTQAALWIDVEGASGKVLLGARTLLQRTAVLIIEVEELNWWGAGHWRRDQVEAFLFDQGLIPVARDFQYPHQYNIVFVQDELLRSTSELRWALARFASRDYVKSAGKSLAADLPATTAVHRVAARLPLASRLVQRFRKAPRTSA